MHKRKFLKKVSTKYISQCEIPGVPLTPVPGAAQRLKCRSLVEAAGGVGLDVGMRNEVKNGRKHSFGGSLLEILKRGN